MVCEAFGAVLRLHRNAFNARFEQARRRYPLLDGADFTAFLEQTVDPFVRSVDAIRPQCVADAVQVSFDLGLELVGQRLAGPRARHDRIDQAWRRVLTANARLVAQSPVALASAVCNAVHHIGALAPSGAPAWIEGMCRLGPSAADESTLLLLGKVLAWRCGLAHYRAGALAAAAKLPAPLALAAFGAPDGASWEQVHVRLLADPWYLPGRDGTASGPAAVVGAFRGFDGSFRAPPQVAALAGQLIVHSADECWLLLADAFGATLHRASTQEAAAARPSLHALPSKLELPELAGRPTSLAESPSTIAVTCARSHRVFLFARTTR